MFNELNSDAVTVTELLVATPEHGDLGLEACVHDVLKLVREKTQLEVVFVRATRPDGERDIAAADMDSSHPLEAAWGEHLLSQDQLAAVGSSRIHLTSPVTLGDGSVYGTLCVCARDQWTAHTDGKLLRSTAMLIAEKIYARRRPLRAVHRPSWGDQRAAAGARRFEGDPTRP